MPDVFTPEDRSRVMRAVKSKNTTPELRVRRAAHKLGYRFRLYRKDLPGRPDLVFAKHRTVIFVHGCFWHAHDCARGARIPKTNTEYWLQKRARNQARDAKAREDLEALGWRVATIWECETKPLETLKATLHAIFKEKTGDGAF
ncbi:MAG: very short patch repair endonuclease [Pseudomonadota bacterium]